MNKLRTLIEICHKAGSAGIPLKELINSFENKENVNLRE